MISHLSNTWKKIKDEPASESLGKVLASFAVLYTTSLVYHHRAPIYTYISNIYKSGVCKISGGGNLPIPNDEIGGEASEESSDETSEKKDNTK